MALHVGLSYAQTCPTPALKACKASNFCSTDSLKLDAPTAYGHVSTYAGHTFGNLNGNLQTAQFYGPRTVAFDPSGNMFIGDEGNSCIRKISTDGMVSTFGGSPFSYSEEGWADGPLNEARFPVPGLMVFNNDGSIFQCGIFQHSIRRISGGMITEFVGNPYDQSYKDDTLTAARFTGIAGMVRDAAGNLYVSDMGNHCIRKITPAGLVSTIAGKPGIAGFADGDTAARFNKPAAIAFDRDGNLVVCDRDNRRVRKITLSGVVSTIAGNGTSGNMDGTGTAATFDFLENLAVDASGNIFVSDGLYIRKITPAGVVSKFAGNGVHGNVNGTGAQASFGYPLGMAFNSAGDLFVADADNNAIRKITPTGVVSTYAGIAYNMPQNGDLSVATFTGATGLSFDRAGNLYVVDGREYVPRVRKITPAGLVSTLAGGNANNYLVIDGTGDTVSMAGTGGISAGDDGNVYIVDYDGTLIRKISPAGTVSTIAGSYINRGYADGQGAAAKFDQANAMAFDPAGNLYVSDQGGRCIRKITPSGLVTTFAGNPTLAGIRDGIGSAAEFNGIRSLAWGPDGYFYAAEVSFIRRISLNGEVTTLGTGPLGQGLMLGDYNSTCLDFGMVIEKLAFDRNGDMYITAIDASNPAQNLRMSVIKKISRKGILTTIAGSETEHGLVDGDYTDARFYGIGGMAFDSDNNMLVADTYTRRIRKVNMVNATGYLWSNGATTQNITAKQTGDYSVRTIYGTCTSAASNAVSVVVTPMPAKPGLTLSNDSLSVNSVSGDSTYHYVWYLDGAEYTSTVEHFLTGITEGTVTVVAVNNGLSDVACSSAVSEPVVVNSIEGKYNRVALNVVPNPSKGLFTLHGLEKQTNIRIINSIGRSVFNGIANGNSQIDLQNLPAGIYRLIAEDRQVSVVKAE
ncbi:MAG: T9SS type A sorting domain-containing protein [Bacteroidota bacterium]